MPRSNSRAGVGYFDVATAMREVGRAHDGRVFIRLSLPVRESNVSALDVQAVFNRRSGRSGVEIYERSTAGYFPGTEGGTLAGKMFRLVHELDGLLTRIEEEAEQSAQDRLPF